MGQIVEYTNPQGEVEQYDSEFELMMELFNRHHDFTYDELSYQMENE